MSESKDYILIADYEGEESSRVCGRTSSDQVAKAWALGDGHWVVTVPLDGELIIEGYEALEF